MHKSVLRRLLDELHSNQGQQAGTLLECEPRALVALLQVEVQWVLRPKPRPLHLSTINRTRVSARCAVPVVTCISEPCDVGVVPGGGGIQRQGQERPAEKGDKERQTGRVGTAAEE